MRRVVVAVIAVACMACEPNEASVRPAPPPPATPVTPSRVLTVDDLPEEASTLLRDSLASFVAWDTAQYPDSLRKTTRRSSDEGLTIVRGDLQGAGTIDFVIAGRDHTGPRTVALLAQKGRRYRLVYVLREAELADTLEGVPPVILQLVRPTAATRGQVDLLVIHLGEAPGTRPERWSWVATRGEFLLVEPND